MVSTVQVYVAGSGSTTPPTVAATVNVCDPFARPVYVFGLVHAPAIPASSLHVYVALVELAWNVKDALVLVVPTGGVVSRNVSGFGVKV